MFRDVQHISSQPLIITHTHTHAVLNHWPYNRAMVIIMLMVSRSSGANDNSLIVQGMGFLYAIGLCHLFFLGERGGKVTTNHQLNNYCEFFSFAIFFLFLFTVNFIHSFLVQWQRERETTRLHKCTLREHVSRLSVI